MPEWPLRPRPTKCPKSEASLRLTDAAQSDGAAGRPPAIGPEEREENDHEKDIGDNSFAGPLAVLAVDGLSNAFSYVGFRCAR